MAVPSENSRSASVMENTVDVEKTEPDTLKLRADGEVPNEYVRPINTTSWILVCVGIYLGAILYGLDTTIAADVQGSILESLGEIEKLAWVGIGFPMGGVSLILLIGTLYGLFDIKYLLIGGIVCFEVGSAICGAAPTMNAMIVGRVVAGIGGAFMYLGALNYIAVFTSLKERGIYNAFIGLSWGTGCILGPIVGGGFADSGATWRWAFYINLPLAALCAPVYIFLFPSHNPQPSIPARQKLASIDWVGALLMAATICIFLVVLTFAGSTWAWDSAGPIALWVIFGVCLIAFILQQAFSIFTTPERRLFPVEFLKSRTMLLLYFATSAAATGMGVTIYFIPLFFQFTKADSAIQAAVRLLPFIALFVGFSMFSGALLPVFGRYMPWYIPSGIFMIVGGALMFKISPTTHTSAIYGFEILIAIGAGLTGQIGYSVAAAKVKPEMVPAAIGFMNIAQTGSIAIALAIAGSIFQNLGFSDLKAALADYNFSDIEIRQALAGAQSAILAQGDQTIIGLAITSIVGTIGKIFALIIAAGALIVVCGAFMRREKLQLNPAAMG